MSIRRLTNVQEARRILRDRRARCTRAYHFQAQVAEALRNVSRQSYPETPQSSLTIKEIAHVVRKAGRQQPQRLFKRVKKFDLVDVMYATREPGPGAMPRVRFWLKRIPQRDLEAYQHFSTSHMKAIASTTVGRGYPVLHCGPCSEKELVAIDTLLERGDRHAEHLAKVCKGGAGGFLEGAKRRRKR